MRGSALREFLCSLAMVTLVYFKQRHNKRGVTARARTHGRQGEHVPTQLGTQLAVFDEQPVGEAIAAIPKCQDARRGSITHGNFQQVARGAIFWHKRVVTTLLEQFCQPFRTRPLYMCATHSTTDETQYLREHHTPEYLLTANMS